MNNIHLNAYVIHFHILHSWFVFSACPPGVPGITVCAWTDWYPWQQRDPERWESCERSKIECRKREDDSGSCDGEAAFECTENCEEFADYELKLYCCKTICPQTTQGPPTTTEVPPPTTQEPPTTTEVPPPTTQGPPTTTEVPPPTTQGPPTTTEVSTTPNLSEFWSTRFQFFAYNLEFTWIYVEHLETCDWTQFSFREIRVLQNFSIHTLY